MRLGRAQPFTSTHSYLRPPAKVLPVPLQREQTVTVALAAVGTRRKQPRYMPLQGWVGSRTATTGFKVSVLGVSERNLGPEPPEVVLAPPPQFLQTIRTSLVAVRSRRDLKRRVPPMWLEPSGTKTTTGAIQTFGMFEPALGPMPPQLVLGIPALRDRTTFVWTLDPTQKQRLRQAIRTRSTLSPPTAAPPQPTLAQQTVTVRLASRLRRHDWRYYPLSAYYGPSVVNPPLIPPVETTLHVHLVRQVRRSAQRALYPPVTTTPFVPPGAPYAVTTLKKVLVPRRHDWRRQVLHILFAPAVVSLRPPVVTRLRTSLVPRRTNQRYKATHFYRGPMVVGAPTPPVTGTPTRMLMGVGK